MIWDSGAGLNGCSSNLVMSDGRFRVIAAACATAAPFLTLRFVTGPLGTGVGSAKPQSDARAGSEYQPAIGLGRLQRQSSRDEQFQVLARVAVFQPIGDFR